MMTLDPLNSLNKFPLTNLDKFIDICKSKGITEINLTGTNTDPLLYEFIPELKRELLNSIPNLVFGIRTNGALSEQKVGLLKLFDKGSITICSFDEIIYRKMMGLGKPPNLREIMEHYSHFTDLKINVVLGDENVENEDILRTIDKCSSLGISKINLREPYGQPHIGDPLRRLGFTPTYFNYGMPVYKFWDTKVCYWDVHYVEVESVNLYANGIVSQTYPITRGHDPINGKVIEQSSWGKGRHYDQWKS